MRMQILVIRPSECNVYITSKLEDEGDVDLICIKNAMMSKMLQINFDLCTL